MHLLCTRFVSQMVHVITMNEGDWPKDLMNAIEFIRSNIKDEVIPQTVISVNQRFYPILLYRF